MQTWSYARSREAEKAWKGRELDKVVRLYASIEDQLTVSEKAKLAYASNTRAMM